MNHSIISANRNSFIHFLEKFTPEQLYTIPKGFNNHILWNIAHTLVTEQLLIYGLSNLPLKLEQDFVDRYKKGSQPLKQVDLEEITLVKSLLKTVSQETEVDYKAGKFKLFTPYKTSAGFELNSIQDAITFNTYHEGIHLGIILALKKLI
jgi:hypothetical protein